MTTTPEQTVPQHIEAENIMPEPPPFDPELDVMPLDIEAEEFAPEPFLPGPKPDKTVPYSLEAEESVLGALLIDHEAMFRVASFLKPDDFYIVKNGWIYDIILS